MNSKRQVKGEAWSHGYKFTFAVKGSVNAMLISLITKTIRFNYIQFPQASITRNTS